MKKGLIWGTGIIASRVLENGLHAEVLGYIETYTARDCFQGKKVYKHTEIPKAHDAIIVANKYSNEIYRTAKNQNLDMEKMIFLYPVAHIDSEEKMGWKYLAKKILNYIVVNMICMRKHFMREIKSFTIR